MISDFLADRGASRTNTETVRCLAPISKTTTLQSPFLGLAVAADDPFSDNNLNKQAAGTNQDSDRSTAVGDDQAVQGGVNDAEDNDGNVNSQGAIASDGGDVANGASKVDSDRNNDTGGTGAFSPGDGDVKRNDFNASTGDGNSTADGDVEDNDEHTAVMTPAAPAPSRPVTAMSNATIGTPPPATVTAPPTAISTTTTTSAATGTTPPATATRRTMATTAITNTATSATSTS